MQPYSVDGQWLLYVLQFYQDGSTKYFSTGELEKAISKGAGEASKETQEAMSRKEERRGSDHLSFASD